MFRTGDNPESNWRFTQQRDDITRFHRIIRILRICGDNGGQPNGNTQQYTSRMPLKYMYRMEFPILQGAIHDISNQRLRIYPGRYIGNRYSRPVYSSSANVHVTVSSLLYLYSMRLLPKTVHRLVYFRLSSTYFAVYFYIRYYMFMFQLMAQSNESFTFPLRVLRYRYIERTMMIKIIILKIA